MSGNFWSRRSRRPILRLMPDYGAEWPLWTVDGMVDPKTLGLSEELADDLRVWQELFDANFDPERGWVSVHARQCFRALGRRIYSRLVLETGNAFKIDKRNWPR